MKVNLVKEIASDKETKEVFLNIKDTTMIQTTNQMKIQITNQMKILQVLSIQVLHQVLILVPDQPNV
jgi:hypothetical protein